MKTVFIAGLTSDIGRELALRYARDGWKVSGTVRLAAQAATLPSDWRIFPCDFATPGAVEAVAAAFHATGLCWDFLIVAVGTELPIGNFLDCDAAEWVAGITINALAPLRLVRALAPWRAAGETAVAFFSGSGTNNAAPAYSAYAASKIFLMKMCELLDAESADISYFIVGPGIVRTKIHEQTLAEPARSGANHRKVVDFLASASPGTSHDEIHACFEWCRQAGKPVVGGRNLSLVFDAWRGGGEKLRAHLLANPNLYKLRRLGNDLQITD